MKEDLIVFLNLNFLGHFITFVDKWRYKYLFEISSNLDVPLIFREITVLKGMTVEFILNEEEKTVHEQTKITGFALELIDYPFYSFEIIETRL